MSSFYLLEAFNLCIIAIKMSTTHDKQEEKVDHALISFFTFVLWNVLFNTIMILFREVFETQRIFAPRTCYNR